MDSVTAGNTFNTAVNMGILHHLCFSSKSKIKSANHKAASGFDEINMHLDGEETEFSGILTVVEALVGSQCLPNCC